jgi:hypothetical protein
MFDLFFQRFGDDIGMIVSDLLVEIDDFDFREAVIDAFL